MSFLATMTVTPTTVARSRSFTSLEPRRFAFAAA
jgi:hypothetical protein